MILTEDKKRPLPHPPSPSVAAGSDASSSSSAWGTSAPPPYSPAELATPRPAPDPRVDLLEDDSAVYTDPPSPSVLSATSTSVASTASPYYPVEVDIEPSPIPNLPRQNRLRIQREHVGISETLVLDPSLPAPPGSGEKALELASGTAHVFARVYVVEPEAPGAGAGRAAGKGREKEKEKGRVQMEARSRNGHVRLTVAECPRTIPLSLLVTSDTGPCEVYLPQSYSGPLTLETRSGVMALNSSLRARTRTLDESRTGMRVWVGEWTGGDGEGVGVGDECVVRSGTGTIRVGYWEGEGVVERVVGGFFKRLFGAES